MLNPLFPYPSFGPGQVWTSAAGLARTVRRQSFSYAYYCPNHLTVSTAQLLSPLLSPHTSQLLLLVRRQRARGRRLQ
jgi:hypothetical protein